MDPVYTEEENPPVSLGTLLRLQNWLSPAFPTGAFAFSHGLESAIEDDRVCDADSFREWIIDLVYFGSLRNDAILLQVAYAASLAKQQETLKEIAELAIALSAGNERCHETLQLGASFRRAALQSLDVADPLDAIAECPLPVAIGALAAAAELPLLAVLAATLQSSAANLAWVATRLVPLGQSDTLRVLASLEPIIAHRAKNALSMTLDDLGGCALLADIDSLRHERQRSRVCRT